MTMSTTFRFGAEVAAIANLLLVMASLRPDLR
jgi:hypothetical protein